MPSLARFAFLLVFMVGCYSCEDSAEGVRQRYVTSHRDTFTFTSGTRARLAQPLSDLLAEKGYTLEPAPVTADKLVAKRQNKKTSEEYVVHLIDLRQRAELMVQLVHVTYAADGTVESSDRDTELEWQLIQRVDPDRALAIMNEANSRADKVPPRTRRP
ncbi:MAG: hypothetical protein ABI867_20880 [Kofleriaceae bacterium]